MKRHFIVPGMLALAAILAACGQYHDNPGENYGNIAAGESGIILTEAEHSIGWGKEDCFACHNDENIHQTDRTGTGLNLEAIRSLTEREGLGSCVACHGTNGVE